MGFNDFQLDELRREEMDRWVFDKKIVKLSRTFKTKTTTSKYLVVVSDQMKDHKSGGFHLKLAGFYNSLCGIVKNYGFHPNGRERPWTQTFIDISGSSGLLCPDCITKAIELKQRGKLKNIELKSTDVNSGEQMKRLTEERTEQPR